MRGNATMSDWSSSAEERVPCAGDALPSRASVIFIGWGFVRFQIVQIQVHSVPSFSRSVDSGAKSRNYDHRVSKG